MSYFEGLKVLLENNMSERGYKLWSIVNDQLPNIWSRPSSSTGKYHIKDGKRQSCIDEHVYDMAFTASKILRLFDVEPKTTEADILFLAISLHDSLKYGEDGLREHTDKRHDKMAGDMIQENQDTFLKLLTKEQYDILIDVVRFHSGRWSTDATKNFSFNNRHCYIFFVHLLDMLSTNDLVKIPDDILY